VPGATSLDGELRTVDHARQLLAVDLPEPKFKAPVARRELVRRTGLLSRLEHERARPLVLVTAPAGYGKTTVLTQWSEASARPFAWVTLDEVDGDPDDLADSVAYALATIGVEPGLRRSFVLVLDDAQIIPPTVLKRAVLSVLGWLPDGSQLAVASRREPPLALARMRAHQMLVEVCADDLALSAVEATSLLRAEGLHLDSHAIRTLIGQANGWPAALELAATSYAQLPRQASLPEPRGDDYAISEYFRAEVLAGLSSDAVRFLVRSSVLDRLSGALCDAALKRKDSAKMLSELARSNVPLRPLDASHEWYGLHGLFREMLQTELQRTEPELQAAVHRRASEWHRGAGDLDRAIDHARLAGDLELTGELLWANLYRYLGDGRNHMVQRWLDGITAEQTTRCAALALVAAHSHLASGRAAVAEQWARSAAVKSSEATGRSPRHERAGALIIEAWTARRGAVSMRDDAARAYELLPADSPLRASCCFLLGTAALLTGDELAAEQQLDEGAARGTVLAPDATSLCLAQLAVLAAQRDEIDYASDLARRSRCIADERGVSGYPASALMFAVCAATAARERRVDEAKAAVSDCLGLLAQLDDSVSWLRAEVLILVGRVSLALGDVAGAREMLAAASRNARRVRDVGIFQRWFDDAWNQFDARAEAALAGIATLTTAELRVLRFLPTHYSFHEIAVRLHVSSNTVKTHVHAVYRKLDACSRSQAVARATDAGLLS
jgi:LuxR family transcriptional regulator, maltose regulon positive regulatory protein